MSDFQNEEEESEVIDLAQIKAGSLPQRTSDTFSNVIGQLSSYMSEKSLHSVRDRVLQKLEILKHNIELAQNGKLAKTPQEAEAEKPNLKDLIKLSVTNMGKTIQSIKRKDGVTSIISENNALGAANHLATTLVKEMAQLNQPKNIPWNDKTNPPPRQL